MIRELTQKRLKEVIDYDLETGVWTWRHRPENRIQWNARFVGVRAGCVDPDTGYWRIRIDDKLYYAHRLSFLYVEGSWPPAEVDHKHLDRSDCRWSLLRKATHSENSANKIAQENNTSGFKGVSVDMRSELWSAELQVDGKRYRKSGFKTALEASEVYAKMVEKYCGGFGRIS